MMKRLMIMLMLIEMTMVAAHVQKQPVKMRVEVVES